MRLLRAASEDQGEQADHDQQTDEKDDTDSASQKLQHGMTP